MLLKSADDKSNRLQQLREPGHLGRSDSGVFVRRGVLLAVALIARVAYAYEPAPTSTKTPSPLQAQSAASDQALKNDKRGTKSEPLVVDIVPASDAKEREQWEREKGDKDTAINHGIENFNGLLVLFTIVLGGVGIWQAILVRRQIGLAREEFEFTKKQMTEAADLAEKQMLLTGRQADLIEKQKEISRLQFLATHRPRIILREAYALQDAGKPVIVCYTLANTGGTSARIVESALAVTFEPAASLHMGPVSAGKNDVGDIVIEPGAHEAKEFISPNVTWGNGQVGNAIGWGYFFSGHIVYEDNGILRHLAFFRSYDFTTHRLVPIEDPQLEYCDEGR